MSGEARNDQLDLNGTRITCPSEATLTLKSDLGVGATTAATTTTATTTTKATTPSIPPSNASTPWSVRGIVMDTFALGDGGWSVPAPPLAYPTHAPPVTSGAYRAAIRAQIDMIKDTSALPFNPLARLLDRKKKSTKSTTSSFRTLGIAASILSWTMFAVFAVNAATVSRKERQFTSLLERRRELIGELRQLDASSSPEHSSHHPAPSL